MSSEISVSPEAYRSASLEAYKNPTAPAKHTPSQVPRGASCLRGLAKCIACLAGVALFAVVCSGLTGSFTNVAAFGLTVVVLAGAGFLLSAAGGNFRNNKTVFIICAIFAAVVCTLGALNIAGILTMKQVGIGYFGAMGSSVPVFCIGSYLDGTMGEALKKVKEAKNKAASQS